MPEESLRAFPAVERLQTEKKLQQRFAKASWVEKRLNIIAAAAGAFRLVPMLIEPHTDSQSTVCLTLRMLNIAHLPKDRKRPLTCSPNRTRLKAE